MTPKDKGFAEQAAVPYAAGSPAQAASRAVTLVPEQQRWVDKLVADGRFNSADDVVICALHQLMQSMQREVEEDDDWVIPLIEEARDSTEPSIPGEEVQKELREKHARLFRSDGDLSWTREYLDEARRDIANGDVVTVDEARQALRDRLARLTGT